VFWFIAAVALLVTSVMIPMAWQGLRSDNLVEFGCGVLAGVFAGYSLFVGATSFLQALQ
jgi:uncharacterized UPF0160 family protein